jgi:hypothetical protein
MVVWTIMNVEHWDSTKPQPRTIMPPPMGMWSRSTNILCRATLDGGTGVRLVQNPNRGCLIGDQEIGCILNYLRSLSTKSASPNG